MRTSIQRASREYDVLVERGLTRRRGASSSPGASDAPHGGHRLGRHGLALYGERAVTARLSGRATACTLSYSPRGEREQEPLDLRRVLHFLGEHRSQPQRRGRRARRRRGGRPRGLCRRDVSARHPLLPRCRRRCWPRSIRPSAARPPSTCPRGKNQAGSFYQPCIVICDPNTLDTLPEEQYRCGCAEVIKYSMLGNAAFFQEL